MAHLLKNETLEILIDLPLENYNFSRFDWTGKITSVKYKGTTVSGREKQNGEDDNQYGKGFYNEFGMKAAVGYSEAQEGEWFHKIGVGLLKKEGEKYVCSKKYDLQPANFEVITQADHIIISTTSPLVNGYSYVLKKEIRLTESGFNIKYYLKNTGNKIIETDEYTHNFIAFNETLIGSDLLLKFPFKIKPELFDENVNPEGKVTIGQKEFGFTGTPQEQFFFGTLSGDEKVEAGWELINTKTKIGIRETGDFKSPKVNIWGWIHVISPELYINIAVEPGKDMEWSRTYAIFEFN